MAELKTSLKSGIPLIIRDESLIEKEQELINEFDKHLDHHQSPDAIIIEEGKIKPVLNSTLWYGFRGIDVETFCKEWRSKYDELVSNAPANAVTRRFQFEDSKGKKIDSMIKINRQYFGHTFTDEEVDKLFNGEVITIEVIKNGIPTTVRGKLTQKTWDKDSDGNMKELIFYGFNPNYDREEGNYNGKTVTYKTTFGNYDFSEDEKKRLLKGEPIYCIITKDDGKRSSVKIKLVQKSGTDYYYPSGDFNIPWCRILGRNLTVEQVEMLDRGQELTLTDLVTRD